MLRRKLKGSARGTKGLHNAACSLRNTRSNKAAEKLKRGLIDHYARRLKIAYWL